MDIQRYQSANGPRYMVRYRKPNGHQTKKRGFATKRDAELWAAQNVTTAKAMGTYIDPTKGTKTVAALWPSVLSVKALKCKPSYLATLEKSWKTHVQPRWGARRLKTITHDEVQQWIVDMAQEDKSVTVMDRALGILRDIFKKAMKDQFIAQNPVEDIVVPPKPRKPHTYLTTQQLFALADASTNKRILILFLGTVGVRWGEAVALTVGDVDLDRHRISINKALVEVNNHLIEGLPKNNKTRLVTYPDLLHDDLVSLCKGKPADAILFPNQDGNYMRSVSPNSGRNWFMSAKRKSGLLDTPQSRLTIHDLRHTAASLMVKSGANVKAIQNQLGHAKASMTLDVYADLFPDDLDIVSTSMNELLLKTRVGVAS